MKMKHNSENRNFTEIPFKDIAEAIIWQLPHFVIWKDIDSVYLGCNENFAKLAGYSTLASIEGIKDEDLKCDAATYATRFRYQDQQAMKHKPQTILDIHRFADGKIWTCLSNKTPLRNKDKKIIGCINQMTEINIPFLTKLGIALTKFNQMMNIQNTNSLVLEPYGYESYHLSKRESECLFYLLRGKTAKEIARALTLSHRTVEGYIENIKFKLCCRTKTELIGKAIDQGLLTIIPMSILPNSLSKIIITDT